MKISVFSPWQPNLTAKVHKKNPDFLSTAENVDGVPREIRGCCGYDLGRSMSVHRLQPPTSQKSRGLGSHLLPSAPSARETHGLHLFPLLFSTRVAPLLYNQPPHVSILIVIVVLFFFRRRFRLWIALGLKGYRWDLIRSVPIWFIFIVTCF